MFSLYAGLTFVKHGLDNIHELALSGLSKMAEQEN